jgi:hypothetical protein
VLLQNRKFNEEKIMRIGLLGLVLILLLAGALVQNVAVGGVGGLLLLIVLIMFLTGRA